jgi:WD40 repeat protein
LTIGLDSYVAQVRADGQVCSLVTVAGLQLHRFEVPAAHQELAPETGPRLWNVRFSPDGRWLAASVDKRVGVWDWAGSGLAVFTNVEFKSHLFWTPDSRELIASGEEHCSRWRIQPATNSSAPPVIEPVEFPEPAGYMSLSLASNLIVWTGSRGSQASTATNSRTDERSWVRTAPGLNKVSPNGKWLGIYRAYDSVLHVYRLPEIEPVATLTNQGRIAGFNYSPLVDEVAVASRGQVEFWSTTSWERTRVATNFIGLPYLGVLYQQSGDSLWLLKDFRGAGLYDSRTFEPRLLLPTGTLPVSLSADDRYLAVSVEAQRLQVWDLAAVRDQLRELGLDWP